MGFIIIGLLALGIYMAEFLSKEAPNRLEIYNLHKSFGVVALTLIFTRIINRFVNKAPKLPESMPKKERTLSAIIHAALYLLMIIIPLSGYLMSNSFGYPVSFFGFEMMTLAEKNMEMGEFYSEIHEISAYSIIALIGLHVLGALKHRFFDRPENDVLGRML